MTDTPSAPATTGEPLAAPARLKKPRWLPMVLVTWVLLAAGLIAKNFAYIQRVELHDPDDELRLVQVRDLLAGQGWFDLHQYRVAAADGGVLMHWSRLVDIPIASIIALLRPFVGQANAEFAALIAVPALTLLALMAIIGWIGARTLPSARHRLMALICLVFSAPVIMQLVPLRIDHHGWQIVLAMGAIAAFLVPSHRKGGLITGAALATWMSISLEGLPFAALIIGVLAGWALLDRTMVPRLLATMAGLAATSAALFLATRGLGDLSARCDAISPVHVGIFAWGALTIGIAGLTRPDSRIALLAGLATAGIGAVAGMALVAPQCVTGTFDMLDPVVRTLWYDKVLEGQPVWKVGAALMAQYAVPPLVGLWASLKLARASEGPLKTWWLFYAVLLAGATIMAVAVARSAAIAGAMAVLPLGWQLIAWIDSLKRPANPLLRVGELVVTAALMFTAVMPAIPVLALQSLVDPSKDTLPKGDLTLVCSARKVAGAIDALPPGDLLAQLDFGPNLISNTHRGVLATGHHRGAKAMRDVILTFVGPVEAVPEIMTRHKLRYLLLCPRSQEISLYRDHAPQGLAAMLHAGKVPAWLKPVPLPERSEFQLYELDTAAVAGAITPAGTSAPRR